MRFAPEPVKLRIANVLGSPDLMRGQPGRHPPIRNAINQRYPPQLRRFEELCLRHLAALTKTGRSRISRANCPRWPGLTGAAHLGPETARVWAGQHHRTSSQFNGSIARSAENYP